MRIESSVTSLSWIPSEAVTGLPRAVFDTGVTHYDSPPPDIIDGLNALRDASRFRFANHLGGWIEADSARITACGYGGGGLIGDTTVKVGPVGVSFPSVMFREIRQEPEVGDGWVRFVQTVGGRTALPAPRRVRGRPYFQLRAPTVWTTLVLTVRTDGASSFEVRGASSFPRHWIYDEYGRLAAKVGLTDFAQWWRTAFGPHTPWGDEDSPAVVTEAESSLERTLATRIMRSGRRPRMRRLARDAIVVEQGARGDEVLLLLDGVIAVTVDGKVIAEVGPGAVLGERAHLEGGLRTATLSTVTPCRLAIADVEHIDQTLLRELAQGHRREDGAAS